jgi:hypothetical protein
MKGRVIIPWGTLAVLALVASPVSHMIGDPVHSVWIIGGAVILLGLAASLGSATSSRRT